METSNKFPEISCLSLKDVRLALRMGYNNRSSVKAEYLPELDARLTALELQKLTLECQKLKMESELLTDAYHALQRNFQDGKASIRAVLAAERRAANAKSSYIAKVRKGGK